MQNKWVQNNSIGTYHSHSFLLLLLSIPYSFPSHFISLLRFLPFIQEKHSTKNYKTKNSSIEWQSEKPTKCDFKRSSPSVSNFKRKRYRKGNVVNANNEMTPIVVDPREEGGGEALLLILLIPAVSKVVDLILPPLPWAVILGEVVVVAPVGVSLLIILVVVPVWTVAVKVEVAVDPFRGI